MTTLPLNGMRLRVRLVEVEVSRLKLDPENPRLHSAYLTHDLPARPNEKQIVAVLEQLPEFQALLDAITRNDGVFQPPPVTADFRVLEGNRRVAALRILQAADAKNTQWRTVTVHQLGHWSRRIENFSAVERQVGEALDQVVRASSAVECFNSSLRPYVSVKKHLSQGFLALIALYHNTRPLPQRGNKTPLQLAGVDSVMMTGCG
jgi:hypothetical protein